MKNYIVYFSVFIFFLTSCFGYDSFDQMALSSGKGKAPFISIKELKELISSKTSLLILDTREAKECKVSHIKNAVCIDYSSFSIGQMQKYPKKNLTIVCYCSVGLRSQKIATKLLNNGFEKVYNLYGGIFHWINTNNTVYDSQSKETKQVHGYSQKWSKWLFKGEKILN